jgi:hypothetical protein
MATLERIQVITEVAFPVLTATKVPLWPSYFSGSLLSVCCDWLL